MPSGRDVFSAIDFLIGGETRTTLIVILCIAVFYLNSLLAVRQTTSSRVRGGRRFLLVTAHPDDECMFFSPSLLGLKSHGCTVDVLCLSAGDADGLGATREKELVESCKMLGIRGEGRVTCCNCDDLPDSMTTTWSPEAVAREIRNHADKAGVRYDGFITFDEHGVSGHVNHKSILPGLRLYLGRADGAPKKGASAARGKRQTATAAATTPTGRPRSSDDPRELWVLLTTSLPRKYIGILDAMVTTLVTTVRVARAPGKREEKESLFMCFMSDPIQAATGQLAMLQHWSQMLWFRWFWVAIGRYMYLNELKRVV